uniref:uncharacterized protein n=1 Tax=Myxine glutinosa TaxID=7769 RepID=UPI00358E9E7E
MVTKYLEENDDEQITIVDLIKKMETCLLGSAFEPYCFTHMKSKLLEHFGEKIIISELDGKPNVAFRSTDDAILHEFYQEQRKDDSDTEIMRIIRTAAKLIKKDIRSVDTSRDTYPTGEEMSSTEEAMKFIPQSLLAFLQVLFVGQNVDLKVASIGQTIMQATRPRILPAPLQFGLATEMHHHFASRFIVDTLYKHGFGCSYSEVQKFEKNAAFTHGTELPAPRPGEFIQHVGDNVEHNIRTLDGFGTFHDYSYDLPVEADRIKDGEKEEGFEILRIKIEDANSDVSEEEGKDLFDVLVRNSISGRSELQGTGCGGLGSCRVSSGRQGAQLRAILCVSRAVVSRRRPPSTALWTELGMVRTVKIEPASLELMNTKEERREELVTIPSTKNNTGSSEQERDSIRTSNVPKTKGSFIRIGVRSYKCTICGKTLVQSSSRARHMRIHSGERPYKCSVCGKGFIQPSHYNSHLRTHSDEHPYKCSKCGKCFIQQAHYRVHLRIHHGELPYKCSVCGKAFIWSSTYRTHFRIHSGERPYKCTICGKGFIQSSHYCSHLRIHNGERPYKCSTCGKDFIQSSTYRIHLRIHNGERPYKCTVCGKTFVSSSDLQRHMGVHNEHPYRCRICGKGFLSSSSFRDHMRINSCERPYECATCGKVFRQSSNYYVHLKIHLKERPYKCTVCGKGFRQCSTTSPPHENT